MKPLLALACLLTWSLAAGADDLRYAFIRVSPSGDDAASGTAAAPLRTFAGAQRRIRELKATNGGKPDRSVIVEFADGAYGIDAPIAFGMDDSGSPDHAVVYRSLHRGKAVLTGGRTFANDCPVGPTGLVR